MFFIPEGGMAYDSMIFMRFDFLSGSSLEMIQLCLLIFLFKDWPLITGGLQKEEV